MCLPAAVRGLLDEACRPVKVLVTGASSLIGGGVATSLVRRGESVVTFQRRAVPELTDLPIEQLTGDIRDRDALSGAAEGCDAIVHLAAKVGVAGTWEEYRSVNVDGTANVVAVAARQGVARVVHVSSPSVAHGGEPIIGGLADPPVLGRKRAWYPESKALAEIDALAAASDSLGLVAIRPHLVWGPGDTQLVGRIVERARANRLALVGGGRALVDTTYIDNAIEALIAALDSVAPDAACSGRAYVISNGEPRPIRELVAGICRAGGVPFEPRNVSLRAGQTIGSIIERVWPVVRRGDEPPLTRFVADQLGTAHWFDLRPVHDDLGWSPSVSIDEGLTRLERWYRQETSAPDQSS
jgi:nucleoside-diphosphate-sugar epimerase